MDRVQSVIADEPPIDLSKPMGPISQVTFQLRQIRIIFYL